MGNPWKKNFFFGEWTTHHISELIIGMGYNNGHVRQTFMVSRGFTEDLALVKEIKREGCCYNFSDAKHLSIANTWLRKADKKKITYGSGFNKSKMDFFFA